MATILTDEATFVVDAATRPGTVLLDAEDLVAVTGWELNDDGLCRGDVCVPTRSRPDVRVDGRVDLRVVSELLSRPLAIDDETGFAALGESAATRATQLADCRVDDLVLRDVDGNEFAWSQIGRKKKVLVTWASW